MRVRIRHLTIFLLKEGWQGDDAIRLHPDSFTQLPVTAPSFDGALYLRKREPNIPDWIRFIEPHVVGGTALQMESYVPSAVLVLPAAGRNFALTFGHGRSMLDPESYERRYGLRVVINRVDPDRLRTVDARTHEELTLDTRTNASRGTSIRTFGIDLRRDLVRAVAGEPDDPTFAVRLAGADPLWIDARVTFNGLSDLCAATLAAYQDDRYRERFGWIDQLRPVTDPAETAVLDGRLDAQLATGDHQDIELAPYDMPEPGWTFIPIDAKDGAERASVLDWETLLATCQTPPLTVGQLKSERIAVIGADGTFDRTWSAYNCVVFETRPEEDASLYVLTGGEWFAVDGNFAQQALEFVDTQLSEPNPVLAFAQAAAGIGEDAYNRGAADAIGALCLDRELFRADEARDEVEACDLLTRDGQLVHVKKKEGSKSLSHLFAQGLVAGELLVGDRGFRERLADHAAERGYDVIQVEDYRTNAHEVVYAIIAPEPQQGRHLLPFFSQVNLWRTAERLLQLGYRVSLVRIDQL